MELSGRLGIIADDFTGALLVAGLLEGASIRAPVYFRSDYLPEQHDASVLIIATRSRLLPVDESRKIISQAANALKSAGCASIIYKACASFDSTELGNIGPAADILSDLEGGLPVLMSAGYPVFGCTVHQGYLFYRERLVSESIKAQDPLTPMSDPDLVRFLSLQTRSPVALLSHRYLVQGFQAACERFRMLVDDGAKYVLADTSDDNDVDITVRLAVENNVVLVASDPVIEGFARLFARQANAPVSNGVPQKIGGPGAVIVGSVGPTASAQIAAFAEEHPFYTIGLLDPRGENAVVEAALDWARKNIGDRPFGVSTAREYSDVARAQSVLGQIEAARKAERLLAGIAKGLFEMGVRRLVVSGGETSGAIIDALGIEEVTALPPTQLGSGFCHAAYPAPMMLFLKSGKLGSDDVFAKALDQMREKG
ncbi:uncharacterized protein YgbK (DUF1537 family) [Mesorhizobium sp. J18]|uniref:four-carbon acid sugar kinase family protein n=1 Tax=Mesorhizobium sp. J18 TaxID=935263 RepID=UPI0011998312|nr:four-carbon acid sugar kinase family protein [Mesorhizobium sp. J18]TWG91787.1 uncharacterized protein YgbK (DUF1537 family) [Mesorhizobium sp. J18]